MVPHVAKRGHSFKGAAKYYLYDKKATTSERVDWTYTHNLPTDDPKRAVKLMIFTAQNADNLKREAGIKTTGRKSKHGPVYTYSLAWHEEQQPDKDHMIKSALETLQILKLDEHECVIVSHNDTPHPHIHCMVNLVHPETGKQASIYKDRVKLSEWAKSYEIVQGKIYCSNRFKESDRKLPLEKNEDNSIAKENPVKEDEVYNRKLQAALNRMQQAIVERARRTNLKETSQPHNPSPQPDQYQEEDRRTAIANTLERNRLEKMLKWEREQEAKQQTERARMRELYELDLIESELQTLKENLASNEQRSFPSFFNRTKAIEKKRDELEQKRNNAQQRLDEYMSNFENKRRIETELYKEEIESRNMDEILKDLKDFEDLSQNINKPPPDMSQDRNMA